MKKVNPELISSIEELPSGKKIYFASDFHLGAPNAEESFHREKKIIKWLEHISSDASAIFLLGDTFDFWFEYKTTIPKGFIRFLGKLAELKDRGVQIFLFVGNHDLWLGDYFPNQLQIPVIRNTAELQVNGKKFFLGHGDGLGHGDTRFKVIKKIFTNSACIWMFKWIHPDLGISIAKYWSSKSRASPSEEQFEGEDKERLFSYCKGVEKEIHHDYYVFGHRHLPLELAVSDTSTYVNLGEWITHCNYLEFDGNQATLKTFKG
ncbi:UDP-2,3-diacylglucosamine diphosphatase [Ekhidna sp.]|uniref:UDP-2,3-diacylglucosamine diphosphatase n=1 Tax=Ekhidna sp. TaxID=2608089 RepID=UPI003BAAD617